MTTTVYLYCRVSSKRQSDKGLSLAEQEDRGRRYCDEKNWPVTEVVKEVGSAYKDVGLRQLSQLMERASDGSTILVSTYDRFSRNVLKGVTALATLAKRKIRVVAVSEPVDTLTPAGRYTFTILVASGEFTSANLGYKVQATFSKRKRDGSYVGNAGFGYRIETGGEGEARKRRKVVDTTEATIIQLIEGLRNGITAKRATQLLYKVIAKADQSPIEFHQGDKKIPAVKAGSLRFGEIADLLNDYHVKHRSDKEWTAGSVQRVYGNANKEMVALTTGVSGL